MPYGNPDVPATQFAITTVNVPDRLDLRDMDDRKQLEEESRRSSIDFGLLRAWLPRITLIAVLCIMLGLLWQAYVNWKTAISPPVLSSRLTTALGVPVQVERAQLSFAPTPRLLLGKVSVNNSVTFDQIAIALTPRYLAEAMHGRGFHWGEVVVAPTSLRLDQAQALVPLLPKMRDTLTSGIGSFRFQDLQIADQAWLKGNWQVSLERGVSIGYSKVKAVQTVDGGSVEFELAPNGTESVDYQMLASNWRPPFGLSLNLDAATASGKLSTQEVDVEEYSMSGPFGEIHGSAKASFDGVWKLAGTAESDGIDVASLLRQLAPKPQHEEEPSAPKGAAGKAQMPVANSLNDEQSSTFAQGIASFNGKLEGSGASLQEAVEAAYLVAPLQVRSGVLNGLNLGFIAMNPGSNAEASGGSTRFTSLDGVLIVNSEKTSIRDLRGRAGALLALGSVDITGHNEISGLIHVDLGTTRVLAPIRVRVRGTLADPKFGN